MTAKSTIEYTVQSVNSYLDPQDTIVEGNDVRPKRKTQVTMAPKKGSGVGVFSSLNTAQAQPGRAATPVEVTLIFEEHEGSFPWGAGDTLVLSEKA